MHYPHVDSTRPIRRSPWGMRLRGNCVETCAMTSRTNRTLKEQNQTCKGTIMNHAQEQRRKHAVVRYLAGDKIETICRDLHCAKSWLYKWKARYQADDPTWAKGLSTQPRHKPSQTPEPMAQSVVTLRRTLVQSG